MSALYRQWNELSLTSRIFVSMGLGIILGITFNHIPNWVAKDGLIVDGILDTGGQIFITILKMLVVPIVFVSLVCGTCKLGSGKKFGRIAAKTLFLYLITTAIAITIALFFATLFNIGGSSEMHAALSFQPEAAPSLKQTILNIFPSNPVQALAEGKMLQVIVFSILLGMSISMSGEEGKPIRELFLNLDKVIMTLMDIVLWLAPFGVFCLVCSIFARLGFDLIYQLFGYFFAVLAVLAIHCGITYPTLMQLLGRINPVRFFKKLAPAMMFAFSTSSSSASIPVVMEIVEERLGVNNSIASFVIPLGATINMDGTAIMQGVATVFISNAYHIPIGLSGYLMVILTATLASIGTAGVPSVGLITLTMVLQQVGLPIEGIALIIGVDRLLDMTRTAVNISGDSMVACIVGKSEGEFSQQTFDQ